MATRPANGPRLVIRKSQSYKFDSANTRRGRIRTLRTRRVLSRWLSMTYARGCGARKSLIIKEMDARVGIEPTIAVLQTAALPLGYLALICYLNVSYLPITKKPPAQVRGAVSKNPNSSQEDYSEITWRICANFLLMKATTSQSAAVLCRRDLS